MGHIDVSLGGRHTGTDVVRHSKLGQLIPSWRQAEGLAQENNRSNLIRVTVTVLFGEARTQPVHRMPLFARAVFLQLILPSSTLIHESTPAKFACFIDRTFLTASSASLRAFVRVSREFRGMDRRNPKDFVTYHVTCVFSMAQVYPGYLSRLALLVRRTMAMSMTLATVSGYGVSGTGKQLEGRGLTHDQSVARSFPRGQAPPVSPHLLGRLHECLFKVRCDGLEGVMFGVVEHQVRLDLEGVCINVSQGTVETLELTLHVLTTLL
ncbi:hypothetical protein LX32DRAFT_181823 [Colletotrichum zoysiae]|uniref:Uncharacterized protein n=1 Tax=Colletotrichum zoysiae TaxID=1216348 RepID=A0AAD9HNY2_9PEZI|nr:hypothetical protein LX32DRAFT_181823 [Colletotrichum zoysiae]